MTEKAVVDRIVDGKHAILLVGEAEREQLIPADRLPPEAGPGTWLTVRFEGDALQEIQLDEEETARARRRIRGKMERLRERGRKGER